MSKAKGLRVTVQYSRCMLTLRGQSDQLGPYHLTRLEKGARQRERRVAAVRLAVSPAVEAATHKLAAEALSDGASNFHHWPCVSHLLTGKKRAPAEREVGRAPLSARAFCYRSASIGCSALNPA